jgi:signal transduction histidine kinase
MRHILIPFKPIFIPRYRHTLRGALIGLIIALFILALWTGELFAQFRLRFNDAYYASAPTSGQVVIIAIDNASLSAYGRTPTEWSRTLYADLLTILSTNGARTVAFDILFAEPTSQDDAFITAIQTARQSEARTRVVMPVVGLSVADNPDYQSIAYGTVLTPHRGFMQVIENIGFVNVYPDADNTIRRQLSAVTYPCIHADCPQETARAYGFAITVYLAYLRIPTSAIPQVMTMGDGVLSITKDRQIYVDANGLWMPAYFAPPATADESAFPVFSFVDVLEGRIDPAIFADKAVLVGVMNSTGNTDLYSVPTGRDGRRMAGVEIHAHAFESLLQNISYREQRPIGQIATVILTAVIAGMIYVQLRWWWMLIAGGILTTALMFVLFIRFELTNQFINIFYAGLAVILPIFGAQMLDIVTETMRRQRAEIMLQAEQQLSALRLQIIEEKERQNATLAELSMLKTRMIRMASHDLKNPLGVVITYGTLIQEDVQANPDSLSPEHARFVNSMVKSAHDMLHIIEDILNLEKMRSGNIKRDPLSLHFLLEEVVSRHELEAQEKHQTLTKHLPDEPSLVQGDYRQLFQAVTNLVGNAIKYTPDGGHIDVRLVPNEHTLRIEVQDDGYGISSEAQKNLFQEFYRVRTARTAHIEGTGLGLSLVRAVVEAHGGKIWVTSAEGVGSTFFVELPRFVGILTDDA